MIIWSQIIFVDVVLGFYVPPTAKVIRRPDLGLKSRPKDCRIIDFGLFLVTSCLDI